MCEGKQEIAVLWCFKMEKETNCPKPQRETEIQRQNQHSDLTKSECGWGSISVDWWGQKPNVWIEEKLGNEEVVIWSMSCTDEVSQGKWGQSQR